MKTSVIGCFLSLLLAVGLFTPSASLARAPMTTGCCCGPSCDCCLSHSDADRTPSPAPAALPRSAEHGLSLPAAPVAFLPPAPLLAFESPAPTYPAVARGGVALYQWGCAFLI